MKDKWIQRYRESTKLVENSADILTGFNANLDVSHTVSDLDIDISEKEPELQSEIDSMRELIASIAYCIENGENHEVDLGNLDLTLEGREALGGQAGIMSNYLAGTGNGVIFYTPLLSEELAGMIDEKVLYPVIDGDFKLKNVRDSSNTDRTKRNHIFEFDGDRTGRLIVSNSLKGFGPYFRKGVEENLDIIEENIDCAILSGFHDAEGNIEAKLEKSRRQIEKIEKPVHLEYVHKEKMAEEILGIVQCFDSIGLDEAELKRLYSLLFKDDLEDTVSLGEAFEASRKLMEKYGLERVHLHTYRYHLTVTPTDYPNSKKKIREAMLFGELSAIQMADKGRLPEKKEIEKFDMQNKELHSLDELENFQKFFDLENFARTGEAEIEGFKIVAIPTLIHKDPERTVGMGDIISAGAFISENS